ncbi:type III secretion thermoregulatory protein [Filimonas lacunae]|nr:type III secretion thermoregulatory protein [Filimonas lacunae]
MLMKADKIVSCYIGPQISPEQFVEEHFFLYLIKGTMHGYDGHKHYTLKAGECCVVKKNHLVRYNKLPENDHFEKTVVILDKTFLQQFAQRHPQQPVSNTSHAAFVPISKNEMLPAFLQSLSAYLDKDGKIDPVFANVKREELLLILLKYHPALAHTLFDFGAPEKIDLEAFMNRNFRFNVAVQRFAYLTGRSLTSFKKEFEQIFNTTPSRWLVQKRLQEAYFLMDKKGRSASDVYLEVGFEDLSHFSFAFKKQFGFAPTKLKAQHQ